MPSLAVQIGTSATTNYDDTTVEPGGVYVYWIKAANDACVSRFSTNDTGYAQPVLAVAPTYLAASCMLGQNATSQAFEVWNAGGTTLVYAVSDDTEWLTCNPPTARAPASTTPSR